MKIIVINHGGSRGKTTVLANLLAPFMNNAKYYSLGNWSNFSYGLEFNYFTENQFDELRNDVIKRVNCLIDVGLGASTDFIKYLSNKTELIDYFVIPSPPSTKCDFSKTMFTIKQLINTGVPAHKIKVVFNRISNENNIKDDFNELFKFNNELKDSLSLNEAAFIPESELYDSIWKHNTNYGDQYAIQSLINDQNDYPILIKNAITDYEIEKYFDLHILKSLAKDLVEQHRKCFDVLFG